MNPPPMKAAPPVEDDTPVRVPKFQADDRLPPPGTVITRKYKGEVLHVKVRPDGFEYEGVVYTALCAVAKEIAGSHCNGYLFFRLDRKGKWACGLSV